MLNFALSLNEIVFQSDGYQNTGVKRCVKIDQSAETFTTLDSSTKKVIRDVIEEMAIIQSRV